MSGEESDREYFLNRAKEERERAATCEDDTVAMVHLKLAGEYEKRALASGTSYLTSTS